MGVSEICFEMKGARGPNITQVVKPVSKYKKHASNAFQLPLRSETIKRLIGVSYCAGDPLLTLDACDGCIASPKKKRRRPGRTAYSRPARVGSVALLTQQRVSVLTPGNATDVPRLECHRHPHWVNDLAHEQPGPPPVAATATHQ